MATDDLPPTPSPSDAWGNWCAWRFNGYGRSDTYPPRRTERHQRNRQTNKHNERIYHVAVGVNQLGQEAAAVDVNQLGQEAAAVGVNQLSHHWANNNGMSDT